MCFIELRKYFLYLQTPHYELGIEGRKSCHIRPYPPRVREIDAVVGARSLNVLNRRLESRCVTRTSTGRGRGLSLARIKKV